jgi:SNF2 family DNA or RNA helicase
MDQDGIFYAPADAPYAAALKKAKWIKMADGSFKTGKTDLVAPFIQYLAPSLLQHAANNSDEFLESNAMAPSKGFKVPTPEGMKLKPFQEANVEYIIKRDNVLLAEECGTGKTPIMVCAANMLKPRHVLIICPSTAKYNWALKEWPKWSTLPKLKVGVVETDDWPIGCDVIIINYDILERHKKRLDRKEWDLLILDESHRLNNETSKRTCLVLGGVVKMKRELAESLGGEKTPKRGHYKLPAIPAKRRIFASATPLNRAIDLWTMLRACDPEGLGSDIQHFHSRYCDMKRGRFGYDFSGSINMIELGGLMRSKFMLRHNEKLVLELPELRSDLYLTPPVKIVMESEDKLMQENMVALMALTKHVPEFNNSGAKLDVTNQEEVFTLLGAATMENVSALKKPEFSALFSQLATIRKLTGIAKVPDVVKFVKDKTFDLEEPIVIFAYHREVIAELRKAFPGCAVVQGGMSAIDRMNEVDRFQNGDTNVFIGNLDAASEAITLTRANKLVYAELDWRATIMKQSSKRIHRFTQSQDCMVWYLVAAKSFESHIAKKVFIKMQTIDKTLEM